MNETPFSLDHLPKRDVFQTPEGYFDHLPSRIQARAVASSRQRTPLLTWRRTWLSLGGASLVAALVYLSIPNRQENLGQETLSTVGSADIVGYLNERNLTSHDLNFLLKTSSDETGATPIQSMDTLSPVQQLDVTEEDIRQHLTPEDVRDLI